MYANIGLNPDLLRVRIGPLKSVDSLMMTNLYSIHFCRLALRGSQYYTVTAVVYGDFFL